MNSKLIYLFGKDHEKWVYSDTYLPYVTPEIIANNVIKSANEHFNGLVDKVLWDMFAGVGTDAIRFSKVTGRVICTEICKNTYKNLLTNIAKHKVKNVIPHNIDCKGFNVGCDIIYFDPPWGETFKSGVDFQFSKDILDVALEAHKRAALIIKSPFSCTSFEDIFDQSDIIPVHGFRQQKLKFLYIRKASV